jgi:hypothetical protein
MGPVRSLTGILYNFSQSQDSDEEVENKDIAKMREAISKEKPLEALDRIPLIDDDEVRKAAVKLMFDHLETMETSHKDHETIKTFLENYAKLCPDDVDLDGIGTPKADNLF